MSMVEPSPTAAAAAISSLMASMNLGTHASSPLLYSVASAPAGSGSGSGSGFGASPILARPSSGASGSTRGVDDISEAALLPVVALHPGLSYAHSTSSPDATSGSVADRDHLHISAELEAELELAMGDEPPMRARISASPVPLAEFERPLGSGQFDCPYCHKPYRQVKLDKRQRLHAYCVVKNKRLEREFSWVVCDDSIGITV